MIIYSEKIKENLNMCKQGTDYKMRSVTYSEVMNFPIFLFVYFVCSFGKVAYAAQVGIQLPMQPRMSLTSCNLYFHLSELWTCITSAKVLIYVCVSILI